MNNNQLAHISYDNYYQMIADDVRTQAYKKAIFDTVKDGDIVIDMGTGLGILAIWAVQAGAAKVYAIEKTDAIDLAHEIAEINECSDRIEFIHKKSLDVDINELSEKADVLISETLGSFAIDENTLAFTIDARDRLLKKGGTLIPQKIELYTAAVDNAQSFEKIDVWRTFPGIKLTPAYDIFSSKIMVESIPERSLLSEPVLFGSFDLRTITEALFTLQSYIHMARPGCIHGVAGWFHLQLTDDVNINTAPSEISTHWKQAFFPFKEPIQVIRQDVLEWTMQLEASDHITDNTALTYGYRCTQIKNEVKEMMPQRPTVDAMAPCPCGSGNIFAQCCAAPTSE